MIAKIKMPEGDVKEVSVKTVKMYGPSSVRIEATNGFIYVTGVDNVLVIGTANDKWA